jgi:hypothetical protein
MAKLTASRHLFILLIIGLCLGPLLWLCMDEADSQQAEDRNTSITVKADSLPMADSSVSLPADSASATPPVSQSPLKKLVLPVLITVATGGILLLLYTQRGS